MNAKEFLINEGVDGFFDVKLRAKEIEPLLEQYADHKTEELQKEVERLKEMCLEVINRIEELLTKTNKDERKRRTERKDS